MTDAPKTSLVRQPRGKSNVPKCSHPKESRSLLSGYDVVCGECEQIVGRVALFPCAVLSPPEARAVLDAIPEARNSVERLALSNISQAVRT